MMRGIVGSSITNILFAIMQGKKIKPVPDCLFAKPCRCSPIFRRNT
jgi:hypothetical protein